MLLGAFTVIHMYLLVSDNTGVVVMVTVTWGTKKSRCPVARLLQVVGHPMAS